MDQVRRGWRRDKEGWWYCNGHRGEKDYLKVKVTEGEEETLFGLSEEESELRLLDVLQYATQVATLDMSQGYWTTKVLKVLETADDPVPCLEGLRIAPEDKINLMPVLDAIKSKRLSNLKSLALVGACLNDREVEVLASAIDTDCLPSLKHLDLHGNHYIVGSGHLKLAKAMKSGKMFGLETLNLRFTNMRDACCEDYANAMSSGTLPSLVYMNFGGNNLSTRGIEALGRAIESGELKNLTGVELSDNDPFGFDDSWRRHSSLAEHMGSGRMRALEMLNLARTRMGDEGCQVYAKAMISGELPFLSCVDFQDNGIGDRGAKAFGRVIRSGKLKNLTKLDLSLNNISDEGVIALANSFQEGEASLLPNLNFLSFYRNPFTEVGLRSLAHALKSGRLNSLDKLVLRESQKRSEEGANALISAFSSNIYLTVDVIFHWNEFPALGRRVQQLRKRNLRNKDISKGLKASSKVPAVFGKVYLCGDPKVGKTTLRRTLQRSRRESLVMRKWWPEGEARTRGIDVSQVSSEGNNPGENPITLLVWDMAGQEDYQLVHNSFFPDLSSAEGKATTFVVVCSSKTEESKQQEGSSKNSGEKSKQSVVHWLRQLEYWLKFISSSCGKSTDRRHVLVVLNNFYGEVKVSKYEQQWEQGLEILKEDFKDYLDIQTDAFIMDVRKYQSIQPLKRRLLETSRVLLKDEMIPKISQFIQKNLIDWGTAREQLPVLPWPKFVAKVFESSSEPCTEKTLEAATKYLNESGVLIYIDKEPPSEWNIHHQKLVVLNPNWFCKEIVGNMFLHQDMGHPADLLFRKKVNKKTGSIPESDFKKFFKPLLGHSNEGSEEDFQNLIAILLWLGVCYKGGDQNLFIPALIEENVELAQSTKFNGRSDNDFVSGKYFMTFNVDYMDVLIKVSVDNWSPSLDDIGIFIKPSRKVEDLDGSRRKQCQVDLANDLVEILLRLWIEVCPGVEYLHRVVWPWPASQSRYSEISLEVMSKRNVEVAEVQNWVREHGFGRSMEWMVGSCTIKEDQLLSTKDKRDVVENHKESVQNSLSMLREFEREAVDEGIFPADLLTEEESTRASLLRSTTGKLLMAKLEKIEKTVTAIEDLVRDGFKEVLNKERELLSKIQNTGEFIVQDRERICPRFIYIGKKDSHAWVTLKEALSLKKTACLHFLCEARYNDYRQHAVKDQEGVDLSEFKDWAKKIGPWLKVSLAVLFISAKIAAIGVFPGLGLIVPDFSQWQQASSLSDGLALATDFSKVELKQHIMEGMGLHADDTHQNPREVNGRSRKALIEFLGRMTPDEYEKKLGLRKVCLSYDDGNDGVVWICRECFEKYKSMKVVRELPI